MLHKCVHVCQLQCVCINTMLHYSPPSSCVLTRQLVTKIVVVSSWGPAVSTWSRVSVSRV